MRRRKEKGSSVVGVDGRVERLRVDEGSFCCGNLPSEEELRLSIRKGRDCLGEESGPRCNQRTCCEAESVVSSQ